MFFDKGVQANASLPAINTTPARTPGPIPATNTSDAANLMRIAVATNGGGGVQTTGQGGAPAPVPVPSATPTTTPTTATTPTPTTTPTPAAPPVAGYGANGQYSPQDDSIAHQVDAMTSRAGPLMTRARGIGMAVANNRGLQNSSIAAQSAEKSMLDAAVPIASQEAQQLYGKNLQFQQGKSATEIASMQTAAAAQSAFAQALLSASSSYSSNVSAIMSNPDLKSSARTSALNAAASQRNADYTMIQKVYGVSISATGGTATTASPLVWH